VVRGLLYHPEDGIRLGFAPRGSLIRDADCKAFALRPGRRPPSHRIPAPIV